MKDQMVRWISRVALLIGFAMLFTQCDKTEQANPAAEDGIAVTDRGLAANPGDVCSCLAANYVAEDLSDEETAALAFMREEEKLARDVYLNLYERWNIPVFSNIARSEQRHMDAVLCLIERYGLEDPAAEQPAGAFQNSTLQGLYNSLMEQGAESLEAALTVGATIEDVDILDLQQNIENLAVDNDDILAVFKNLAKGSRNHLRAFTRELEKLGGTYEVQYISAEEYDVILSTGPERGEGLCGTCTGDGPRNGMGNGSGTCDGSGPNGHQGPGNGNLNGGNNGNCPNNNGNAGTGTCNGSGPNGNNGNNSSGPGNGNSGPGNGGGNNPGNGNGNGGGK